jgi:AGCS family alanine or glycine:cation symporter
MKKSIAALITYAVIVVLIAIWGVALFETVWVFPGNYESIGNFPSKDVPLGSIPLMVIALLGTGIFVTIKLGFPQLRYVWHGIKITAGVYDDPNDEGDLNHFRALTTALLQSELVISRELLLRFIMVVQVLFFGCGLQLFSELR